MPLTQPQADALARVLCSLRPRWNYPGVYKQLAALAHHPAPTAVLCQVAIRAAEDTEHVHTPAVIAMDGPHWNLEDATPPKPVRLTPEHECKQHPGQWAGNCGSCTSEKLGGQAWYDLEAPDSTAPSTDELTVGYDHDRATLGAYMAREARRIAAEAPARFAELHPERRTDIAVPPRDVKPAKPSADAVG